jgi:beta-galactosidase/beta-glucuronidase
MNPDMKRTFLPSIFLILAVAANAQWKPAGDRIKTVWAEKADPQNVLPEYPRPVMERSEWKNLNGLWDYAVTPAGKRQPESFDGQILVPFAIESSLSGVQKPLGSDNELWYKRTFILPASWKNKHIILHFGAVDWKAEVYINDIKAGSHTGGYTPFRFDITPFLKSGEQTLVVKVWDPADRSFQPRGKQVSQPANIVYTAVSGIWQTVWLEPVDERHIASLKILPDIDRKLLSIKVNTENTLPGDYVEVKISDNGRLLSTAKGVTAETLDIPVENAKLWSPDSPFLYDLEINLYSRGRLADRVKSYCAMRKISAVRDNEGIMRLQLNNKKLFHLGLLDQGWFPDGLYTAPSDEALAADILKAKELGYNMLRKHVKVEPARWYTHCDRIGMLVWQDMPSGDNNWGLQRTDYSRDYLDSEKEDTSTGPARENYMKEWKEIIDELYSYPCIVMWIPFNEGWGQFNTKEVAAQTKSYDPSRILNIASGGNFYHTGDVLDQHHYPEPEMFLYDANRVNVLGEYGGIGYAVEGHLWQADENFGYEALLKNPEETTARYIEYLNRLKSFNRFSGAVYTQITDVEGEVNGLITYDRKVVKVNEAKIREANREIIRLFSE